MNIIREPGRLSAGAGQDPKAWEGHCHHPGDNEGVVPLRTGWVTEVSLPHPGIHQVIRHLRPACGGLSRGFCWVLTLR